MLNRRCDLGPRAFRIATVDDNATTVTTWTEIVH
jgi:hypothetical protein